ncbi:hypothetical protein [Mangrovimonas aestuarii]|uniref:hypothetical protein n=1 Tax=Mangrovimonas aestuarii TaxID=3018443 RepID=UPI002379F098|nr:hypothetical protein [Mangrovimonas aestuarii]
MKDLEVEEMNVLEIEEKEVLLKCNSTVDKLDLIEDEELISRWTFRFDDIEANSYKTSNAMVVVKSNDEVTFQSNVKSKHKQTRGDHNHLRVKVEGFDTSGLRLFEWTTGTVGIHCNQDEIRQYKKSCPGSFQDIYSVSITFLAIRYRGC